MFRRAVAATTLSLFAMGCTEAETSPAGDRVARLQNAEEWMYQIQSLDEPGAVATLSDTPYPLLVLEPGHNHRPCTPDFDPAEYGISGDAASACANIYDTQAIIDGLRKTPDGEDRLLIAYIDIGQAEVYRDYWAKGWAEATPDESGFVPGEPDFILAGDPDGWAGNFVVAYWDERWQSLWDDIVGDIARLGFDGVYLDWVEAYDDGHVQAAADGLNPAREMLAFVDRIGAAGRAVTPDFLVIQQNATFLIDEVGAEELASVVDALAVEDTWYYGNGDQEDWDAGTDIDARTACEQMQCPGEIEPPDNVCPSEHGMCESMSGDLHGGTRHACDMPGTSDCWSTDNRLAAYARYRDAGIPVFTVDYCVSDEKAAEVYETAWSLDLRPLVTRVQLSRNTETPPWDF